LVNVILPALVFNSIHFLAEDFENVEAKTTFILLLVVFDHFIYEILVLVFMNLKSVLHLFMIQQITVDDFIVLKIGGHFITQR